MHHLRFGSAGECGHTAYIPQGIARGFYNAGSRPFYTRDQFMPRVDISRDDQNIYLEMELSGLTREMAVEFAQLGVRVNAVAPGEIKTEMISPEYEALIPRIPLDRMGSVDDVAGVVFQLCSDDFTYVTGTEIFVTGGQHLY